MIGLACAFGVARAEFPIHDTLKVYNADVTGTLRIRSGSPANGKLWQATDSLGNGTWFVPPYISGVAWGAITGTLASQTDLQAALDAKQPTGNYITALTSDVTASGPGSAAATIAAGAVTNAKMAYMTPNTIKANITGLSASPTDATPSSILDLLTSVRGSILRRGASGWAGVSPGTTAYPFVSNGAGADPSYQILPIGGGGTGNANIYGAANNWTAAQYLSGGARINNTGISDSSMIFLNHFETNAAAGNINWVDSVQPTVNGSPAAASVVADSAGRNSMGNCLTLDGTNDYLSYASIGDVGTSNLTTAAWVKFGNPTATANKYWIAKNGTAYAVVLGWYGVWGIYINGNFYSSGYTVTSTDWLHLAVSVTRSGNAVFYQNGVQVGTVSVAADSAASLSGGNLLIGAPAGQYWAGYMDETMIFSRALSASEVRAIYSQGQEFINKQNLITLAGAQTITGVKTFNNDLLVQPGTASATAAVGGTLSVNTGSQNNTSTGETDLFTYSLPANTLATNGDSVEITCWGSNTNSANVKTLRVYFGSTVISTSTIAGGTPYNWLLKGEVFRTGATSQESYCNNQGGSIDIQTPAATLSGAVTIKITGQGGASSEITGQGMTVKWRSVGS